MTEIWQGFIKAIELIVSLDPEVMEIAGRSLIISVTSTLMVGGNIRGFTRVITTAISLETSKGDLELSIALGIILILIALIVNIALNRIQQR